MPTMFPVLKEDKDCAICTGKVKAGSRYDTIYCSKRCKQAAYIARKKANVK